MKGAFMVFEDINLQNDRQGNLQETVFQKISKMLWRKLKQNMYLQDLNVYCSSLLRSFPA